MDGLATLIMLVSGIAGTGFLYDAIVNKCEDSGFPAFWLLSLAGAIALAGYCL